MGGHLVLWLDADDDISEDTLTQTLHDSERKLAVTVSHPARRQEFLRGRWLAHRACGLQGLEGPESDTVIGRTIHGAPAWPGGLTGSITHKNGHAAAIAAKIGPIHSMGIDMEQSGRVSEGVAKRIMTVRDGQVTDAILASGTVNQDDLRALIFSAKESLYKCLFPLHHRQFWFEDAWLESIAAEKQEFVIRVNEPFGMDGTVFHGHYGFISSGSGQRLIITAITF